MSETLRANQETGTYQVSRTLLNSKTLQARNSIKIMVNKDIFKTKPGHKVGGATEEMMPHSEERKYLQNKQRNHLRKLVKSHETNKDTNSSGRMQNTRSLPKTSVFNSTSNEFPIICSSSRQSEVRNGFSSSKPNPGEINTRNKNETTIKIRKYASFASLPILVNHYEVKDLNNNVTSRSLGDVLARESFVNYLPDTQGKSCRETLKAEWLLDVKRPYPIRSSQFPNVPPYLVFTTPENKTLRPPKEISDILLWKTSDQTPTIVSEVAKRSGFKLVEQGDVWLSTWGKQILCQGFYEYKENQKVNHFPGTFHLGRKDKLWLNIMKMQRIYGKDTFCFMPQTFLLPKHFEPLRQAWFEAGCQSKWIIKPPASARGEGIKVVQRWSDVPRKEQVIVQRYICQPYLINETKFDLRLYVLVTSFDPLRLYVYDDGLVRFASEKYSSSLRHLGENFVHLTNYSINCTNLHYTNNEDENLPQGHKWSLKCLWSYFHKNGIDDKKIWSSLVDVVIKTVISCENPINRLVKLYAKNRYCCYELFGFDIMLDRWLKPWLLEVNISPSLHTDSQLDLKIKSELVRDMFNIMGLHIPEEMSLSPQSRFQIFRKTGIFLQKNHSWNKNLYTFETCREDKAKQNKFKISIASHPSILKILTPGDVKLLVQSEDELVRCGHFVRVFPNEESSFYLSFFEKPKYYNILLDAWERKYNGRREKGVLFLQPFCEQGRHLLSTKEMVNDKVSSTLVKENAKASNSQRNFLSSRRQNNSIIKKKEHNIRKLQDTNIRNKVLPSDNSKTKQNYQLKRNRTISMLV